MLIYLWLVNSACRTLWHVNLLRSETADLYCLTCTAVISWIISLCTCHHGSLFRALRAWLLKSPTQTLSNRFFSFFKRTLNYWRCLLLNPRLASVHSSHSSLFSWLRPGSCGKGGDVLLKCSDVFDTRQERSHTGTRISGTTSLQKLKEVRKIFHGTMMSEGKRRSSGFQQNKIKTPKQNTAVCAGTKPSLRALH